MWCLVVSSARSATGNPWWFKQHLSRYFLSHRVLVSLKIHSKLRHPGVALKVGLPKPFETGPRRVDRRLTCSDWLPGCLESVHWEDKKTRWGSGSSRFNQESSRNQEAPPESRPVFQAGASQNDARVEDDEDWYGWRKLSSGEKEILTEACGSEEVADEILTLGAGLRG